MTKQEFQELTGENPEDVLGNDWENEAEEINSMQYTVDGESLAYAIKNLKGKADFINASTALELLQTCLSPLPAEPSEECLCESNRHANFHCPIHGMKPTQPSSEIRVMKDGEVCPHGFNCACKICPLEANLATAYDNTTSNTKSN